MSPPAVAPFTDVNAITTLETIKDKPAAQFWQEVKGNAKDQ
jgi:hypothetical protein